MSTPKMTKQKLSKIKAQQDLHVAEQAFRVLTDNATRARSVTVGTAFGGTTEIGMRGDGGNSLWCLLQPVEVVELVHQLAANIGCVINLQPRDDFSSWRKWRSDAHSGIGHAPQANSLAPHISVGAVLPAPEEQPGTNFTRSTNDGKVVATEKTVNRRTAKRPTKAA